MTQTPSNTIVSSVHTVVDWLQARWNERDSWDGVTLIILSVVILLISSLVVYVGWAGLAYGGWLVWKKGSRSRFPERDISRTYDRGSLRWSVKVPDF